MNYRRGRFFLSLASIGLLTVGWLGVTLSALAKPQFSECFVQEPSGHIIDLNRLCHSRPASSKLGGVTLKTLTANWQELTTQQIYDRMRSVVVEVKGEKKRGTGFFVDENGLILTSFFLVGQTRTVQVKLDSQKILSGQVIQKDAKTRLALVRLNRESLSRLSPSQRPNVPPLCYANKVKVGESVFVVSYPERTHHSIISQGFINSIGRSQISTYDNTSLIFLGANLDLISTDAHIYWNHLGSPLVDRFGSIVGIIVGGMDDQYGSIRAANMSLAIPIQEAVTRFALPIPNSCGGRL